MTKENTIIGELWFRANLVKKFLVQLERRTISWLTRPHGYSIYVTLSSMGQARAGDVLRKLDLPAGRNASRSVRQKFEDLVKARFLMCKQDGDGTDKYYAVTMLGRTLAKACARLLNSLEKQSMGKISKEGENLALLDLVRDFTQPGEESCDSKVGEIPEIHHPHLNTERENHNSSRGESGNESSRNGMDPREINVPSPITRTRETKWYNGQGGTN